MSEWKNWSPGRPLMAWDTSNPQMVAGAADQVFVAEVISVRLEESETFRARIPVEDSDEFVEMVQPEGRATVKVVERFKGEVPDNVEVMFPPMILVSNPTSGLPEVPVSPGETYVLSTISSRESDLLSVLPDSGILPMSVAIAEEPRTNGRTSPDGRQEISADRNAVDLMKESIEHAVPFRNGMPVIDPNAEPVPIDGIR